MILKHNILLLPFRYSVIGFVLSLVLLSAAIFLGGNCAEYVAFFNSLMCLSFLAVVLKSSYHNHIFYIFKFLIIPLLILFALLSIGYYRYTQYISHLGNLSDIDMTHFIIHTGTYAPVTHFWSLAYWVSIFLMSMLAFIVAHHAGFKRDFIKFFFVVSVLIAVYGLVMYAMGNQMVLWFPKESYLHDLTASFINRNSYATFAGSGVLAGLYCIHNHYHTFMRDYQGTHHTKIAGLIDYISGFGMLYVLSTLLICAALILTHSRAGISLTIGFCCVFYFFTSKHNRLKQRFKILLLFIVLLSFIAPIIMQDFLMRAVDINDHSALRFNVYTIILKMIADYPVFGVGLGGFEYAFQAYRDSTISIQGYWDKAHSTPLEIILEIGIPLAVLLFSVYSYIFIQIIKSYLRYKQSFLILCLSIMGLYITHSCVDFSLQIPAINIVFHIILALGYAESQKRA